MACAACLNRRERLYKMWKSINFGFARTPEFRMFGLYIGPNGQWHAIRLHCWKWYAWIGFKWLPIRFGSEAHEKWL